jgi:hypothetical protein
MSNNVWKKFFRPPLFILVLLIPMAVLLLVFGLSDTFQNTALAYLSYLVSAYVLTAVVLNLPKLIRSITRGFWNLPVIQRVSRNKIGHLLLHDITFRGTASIYQGLVVNGAYAAFRGVTAYRYHSIWFASIAVYYLLLGIIRLSLVYHMRRLKRYETPAERERFEWNGYRICGYLMLLLNVGMSGMAVLMIRDNLHYEYPGYIIYWSALYTFYTAIMAAVHVFKFRKLNSPVLSASKAITFTGAMMSVMALQTAMIARFGADNALFRQAANTITGAAVCVSSVAIAVFMIVKGTRKTTKHSASAPQL